MAVAYKAWNNIFIVPNTHFCLNRMIGKVSWVLMSYLPVFFFFQFLKRLTCGSEHALTLKISIYFRTGTTATKDTVNAVYLSSRKIMSHSILGYPSFLRYGLCTLTVVQAQLSNYLVGFFLKLFMFIWGCFWKMQNLGIKSSWPAWLHIARSCLHQRKPSGAPLNHQTVLLAYIQTLHCLMLIKLQAVSRTRLCILLARRNDQMCNSLLICACCM